MARQTKVIVIAGTQSGVGKTTVALGVMAALMRRGLVVQPFKVGPDFIDPGYHRAICKLPSRNLDGWMLGRAYTVSTFVQGSAGKDIAVIEGVMGLFDGQGGSSDDGSTAQIARWLKVPVILVIDARGMSGSAAALLQGFKRFDRRVTLAGVVLNRVGSTDHYRLLKGILEKRCGVPVVGHLPADGSITIPERYLGLVSAKEFPLKKPFVDRLAQLFERFLDLDLLLRISSPPGKRLLPPIGPGAASRPAAPPVRLGVARDQAFCFYYQDNLDILRQMGAKLIGFSPLRDRILPAQLDGIYIGGGYPELFASDLEANATMRKELKRFAASGGVIYAECGGLMYLGKKIKAIDGTVHTMVGIFPFTTVMRARRAQLGYRRVRALRNSILARRGECARGHQFRYSMLRGGGSLKADAFSLRKSGGGKAVREGFRYKNVLAQYVHIHFGSNRNYARRFVESCQKNMRQAAYRHGG